MLMTHGVVDFEFFVSQRSTAFRATWRPRVMIAIGAIITRQYPASMRSDTAKLGLVNGMMPMPAKYGTLVALSSETPTKARPFRVASKPAPARALVEAPSAPKIRAR